jgi:hypothetical protein
MVSPPRRRVVAVPARVELRAIRVLVEPDPEPDASYLEQDEFEERLAAYEKGEFALVGVRAEAEVAIDGLSQTLKSGGLYGIESDLEQDELDDIATEEWTRLRTVLKTVGVATEKLPLDVQREWIEWRT